MTGVLPVSGVGARISGSTPEGGHNTPSDCASFSPKGWRLWPVVAPSGAAVPPCGAGCIGAQPLAPAAAGGVTLGDGFAGGACAAAVPQAAIQKHDKTRTGFIRMERQRSGRTAVPATLR